MREPARVIAAWIVAFRTGLLLMLLHTTPGAALALDASPFVSFGPHARAALTLAQGARLAPLLLDDKDHPAVQRAAADLQADIERVTGRRPALVASGRRPTTGADVVVIGTLGHSALVDELAAAGRIDTAAIRGRWEGYLLQTVAKPWPGVQRALVIAGADRRGTAFGVYQLSEQIGVSPWYWWADVPVARHATLVLSRPVKLHDAPVVRWRGIFLNDEAPALSGWVRQFHGGYTHSFYDKVFELLLRLRANTMWPAMWGSAFFDDDPRNGPLAHERGIVIGTSHHEPLLRAQQEWHRGEKRGPWDYTRNAEALREFWAGGARRAREQETLLTVGMRGDGDEPMPGDASVALLERIVADQRQIIARETGKPAEQVPQVWALYKEVQGYYESGMRVPDDVTLLWSDDNWGYIRRLPTPDERGRAGGAGVYYHLDYVGGPRSYKWLNVTPLPKIWEQMHLAWRHEATRLWMVNVGDLKPMEVPTEFFLRYAWNPAQWPAERLDEYLVRWATREFGPTHATEIAALVAGYTRFNSRRTPELLGPDTYSRVNYREAERVVADYKDLARRAQLVYDALPAAHRDAFFQLVLYPVQACAVVNELHVATGLNHMYARQGRASTAAMAARVRALFAQDAELTRRYHQDVAGGKWNHMMSQAHIGYTGWNQPRANIMPLLHEGAPPQPAQPAPLAAMAAMAEGSELASSEGVLSLPTLDRNASEPRWIELFNRGTGPLRYSVRADQPWVRVSEAEGDLATDKRLQVAIDWQALPARESRASLRIVGTDGTQVRVELPLAEAVAAPAGEGFIESDGVVAFEAEHSSARIAPPGRHWLRVPGHGRTLSGMTAMPVPAPALAADAGGMRLEYTLHLARGGRVQVHTTLAPTLNFQPGEGLRYAISIDDEAPQIIKVHADQAPATWARRVIEGAMVHRSEHQLALGAGSHTLKFWALDAGLVVQRFVVDAGGLRPSTLGPPESPRQR